MAAEDTVGAVIGLDLGGTKIMAGLFDPDDNLVAKEYVRVTSLSQEDLLETLASVVRNLAAQSEHPVLAAGYGIPTTIDQRSGMAVMASNLPIRNVPFRDELLRRTKIPAFVDNDANVAALAEQRRGAGKGGVTDLIMVTLGTGFGGGIIIDGVVVNGAIGAGAELGHMSIDHNGPPCVAPNCPGIGCIETFCSGSALARDTRTFIEFNPGSRIAHEVANGSEAKGELVIRLAQEGDRDAIGLLERMGHHLGVAMANFVNIFNPELIVIGGGLIVSQEWVLPVAKRVVLERALPPGNEFVRIVPAECGAEAGMIGGALLARAGLMGRVQREHTFLGA
jgi:glucokinase